MCYAPLSVGAGSGPELDTYVFFYSRLEFTSHVLKLDSAEVVQLTSNYTAAFVGVSFFYTRRVHEFYR